MVENGLCILKLIETHSLNNPNKATLKMVNVFFENMKAWGFTYNVLAKHVINP